MLNYWDCHKDPIYIYILPKYPVFALYLYVVLTAPGEARERKKKHHYCCVFCCINAVISTAVLCSVWSKWNTMLQTYNISIRTPVLMSCTQTVQFQLNISSSLLPMPDWDCPQEPGPHVDWTSTRPKFLLLLHQENTHREQRLIHPGLTPSSPHTQSSGHEWVTRPVNERGLWCLFDSPANGSKL